MLFAVLYRWRANVAAREAQRTRRLFAAWEPPAGLEIFAHYSFARGGGVVVVEAHDAAALFEALAPFTSTIDFDVEPIVKVIQALAISMDVEDWVHSVHGAHNSRGALDPA
jgi:hypothetical protein